VYVDRPKDRLRIGRVGHTDPSPLTSKRRPPTCVCVKRMSFNHITVVTFRHETAGPGTSFSTVPHTRKLIAGGTITPASPPARESGREVDIRSMKRHSRNCHSSPWCIRISLWIGATVTFFVSPTSLLPATAGRGDDHRRGALCREHRSAKSWRVCDSPLARADGRFWAFTGTKPTSSK